MQHGGFEGRDSLIDCANQNLSRLQDLIMQNNNLRSEIEKSKDCLQTAKEENARIKQICKCGIGCEEIQDFLKKIKRLAASDKIGKSEEKYLTNFYCKVLDMLRANEIIKAENWHLRALADKLARRTTIDKIQVDREKSKDIPYLQAEVGKLRKEVQLLRQFEDAKIKEKMERDNVGSYSDQDAEILKKIVKERNSLREKCKALKEFEYKIKELEGKAKNAECVSNNLGGRLENQIKYISEIECEMKRMQTYYEDQLAKARRAESCLRVGRILHEFFIKLMNKFFNIV